MSIDRKQLREQLANAEPEALIEALAVLIDAAAEHAVALRMPFAEFAQSSARAFVEAKGQELTEIEVLEEKDNTITTIVAISAKWRDN